MTRGPLTRALFRIAMFGFLLGFIVTVIVIPAIKNSSYVRIDPLPDDAYVRAFKVHRPQVEVLNNGKTLFFSTLPTPKNFGSQNPFPLYFAVQDTGGNLRPATLSETLQVVKIAFDNYNRAMQEFNRAFQKYNEALQEYNKAIQNQ